MARILSRQPDGSFKGKSGKNVQIRVRSSEGAAGTVRIVYAGEQDGKAPFNFTIKKEKHKLLVIAVGVEKVQRMQVVEVDGSEEYKLKHFYWSPAHFHTTLDIQGA